MTLRPFDLLVTRIFEPIGRLRWAAVAGERIAVIACDAFAEGLEDFGGNRRVLKLGYGRGDVLERSGRTGDLDRLHRSGDHQSGGAKARSTPDGARAQFRKQHWRKPLNLSRAAGLAGES